MLQTKYGNIWPCSFQGENKSVKLVTHDDGRRPNVVGQTSDSGNLKEKTSHFWEFISIAMMMVLKTQSINSMKLIHQNSFSRKLIYNCLDNSLI